MILYPKDRNTSFMFFASQQRPPEPFVLARDVVYYGAIFFLMNEVFLFRVDKIMWPKGLHHLL
jgi:hypothetical protein